MVTTDRGDVVELLDASGSSFAAYGYDEWGVSTLSTSSATALVSANLAQAISRRQPLRYAGYCFDAEEGLYYLSARTYDPITRQFLSKDPAKADGEESAYQYCGGDPVGKVDPSGLVRHVIARWWIPMYKITSVLTRQALYDAAAILLAEGAAAGGEQYLAHRLFLLNARRKGYSLLFNIGFTLAPSDVDRALARLTDPLCRGTQLWDISRPTVRILAFRDTVRAASFVEITCWRLRRPLQAGAGYVQFGSWEKRLWTDRAAAKLLRDAHFSLGYR
jgi:RHS repeat-associated protein